MINTKKVLFYDNNPNNFVNNEQFPYIECIEVFSRSIPVRATNISLKNYLLILKNNPRINFCSIFNTQKFNGAQAYALCINQYLQNGHNNYDYIDITSGITKKQINELKSRINLKKNISMVVFDFDRTLTLIEGFPQTSLVLILNSINKLVNMVLNDQKYVDEFLRDVYLENFIHSSKNVTFYNIAEYYFGGKNRINELLDMWKCLRDNNIDIKIVTCNPGKIQIMKVMNVIGLDIKIEDIIVKERNHSKSKLEIISDLYKGV